jgi:hypothetical protein
VSGSLALGRCHPLTDGVIDETVTRRSPGSYALGYLDGGAFVAFYVGRADSDLNDGLHAWVGVDSHSDRYSPGAKAAWGSHRPKRLSPCAPALCSVGVAVDARYTHFEFSYASSAQAAFECECRNYHEFGGSHCLDNPRHPAPPGDVSWTCPLSGPRHR